MLIPMSLPTEENSFCCFCNKIQIFLFLPSPLNYILQHLFFFSWSIFLVRSEPFPCSVFSHYPPLPTICTPLLPVRFTDFNEQLKFWQNCSLFFAFLKSVYHLKWHCTLCLFHSFNHLWVTYYFMLLFICFFLCSHSNYT